MRIVRELTAIEMSAAVAASLSDDTARKIK